MHVVGTAGHVDHGKSTLIEALTGTHPDRLKEERLREMTIDLGFAWMDLDGEMVGIVDVPGHIDFIENMLAGIGGIDTVLFVVAADEGVMPQTREHLAILDLLRIQSGIIVLTKVDLVSDPDWVDLVEEDILNVIQGTVLEGAPCIRVSSRCGNGLSELKDQLKNTLRNTPTRPDLNRPRLWIDRAFSMTGFGPVVTGTLSDGSLQVGDDVEIQPGGLQGRIRGIQAHQRKIERAVPGSRAAINLAGFDLNQLSRGQVLSHPGTYQATQRIDVSVSLLAGITAPLRHNVEVKLFLGSAERLARVRLIGVVELKAGESGWLQLELNRPTIAKRGDKFIIRRPSPGETLGGGEILDPHPEKRHKRFSKEVTEHLETLQKGTPEEVFLSSLPPSGSGKLADLMLKNHLNFEDTGALLELLERSGQIIVLRADRADLKPDMVLFSKASWKIFVDQIQNALRQFHLQFPLRKGIPKEELRSRSGLSAQVFKEAAHKMIELGNLQERGSFFALPNFLIQLTEAESRTRQEILKRFEGDRFTPPSRKECLEMAGTELLNALIDCGDLVAVSPDVLFRRQEYDQMLGWVIGYLSEKHTLTVVEFRDAFATSRKYSLAFLEYMDQQGVTEREGDIRRLRK